MPTLGGQYYGEPFNVVKAAEGVLTNSVSPPIISSETFAHEYYSAMDTIKSRFKQQIKKRDIYEKRMSILEHDEDVTPDVANQPPGITQREAWVEVISAYGDTYPNLAMIARVMLVQLTNSADSERYFSWFDELIAKKRKNIDVDSTLQALSVIKYNVTDRARLNNNIISETLKVFEKNYSRNYKCSDFRL